MLFIFIDSYDQFNSQTLILQFTLFLDGVCIAETNQEEKAQRITENIM